MRLTLLALLSALALAPAAQSQEPLVYQQPSAAQRAVLDAPALPRYSLSPDQRWLVTLSPRRHLPVAELARPVTRLAGMKLDAPSRAPDRLAVIESLSLMPLSGGAAQPLALPPGQDFHGLRWSPDGRRLLLSRRAEGGSELWVREVEGKAGWQRIAGLRLNQVLKDDVAWLSATELLVLAVPDKPGPLPVFAAPSGPAVQESMGKVSPEYTLQNLLQNPQHEALFAHLATSQLRRVDLRTGRHQALGQPDLYFNLTPVAADGQRVMVERLLKPFSYTVRWDDFGSAVELLDARSGRRVCRSWVASS